jgi:hypothetical protein
MTYQEYPKAFHGRTVNSAAEEAAVAKALGVPMEPKPTDEVKKAETTKPGIVQQPPPPEVK